MEAESTSQTPSEYLKELMEIEGVSWIVYTAALVCLVLIAVYVVGLFRNMAIGGLASDSEEDLDLIREIRDRDMIADEEFDRAKKLIREKTTAEPPSPKDATQSEENELKR